MFGIMIESNIVAAADSRMQGKGLSAGVWGVDEVSLISRICVFCR